MFGSRRQLLLFVVAALCAISVRPRSLAAQEATPPITPPRVVERKNPPDPASPTAKSLLENQKAVKRDVERLLELTTQLKSEVEKSDSTDVLSLPLVKKAEEIERLAKQIKKRAQALML